jgi:hypothetical protein
VQCAVPLAGVAAGNHTLALTAWSGPAGTGSKLGANGAIAFTVAANQANVVSGIIGGIATSIALVPANNGATGSLTSGFTVLYEGQAQGFTAEALDAAGNIIINNGTVVAYDALGHQEPHPNAADAINGVNNLGIAYSASAQSLVAYTAANVNTYNSAGENPSDSLSLGAVSLAPDVFAWDAASNTGYGFDTVSQKLVQIGPGANPTTITLLGAAQVHPFTAITSNQQPLQLPVDTGKDSLYAATANGVESLADDASASSAFGAPNVGATTSLAFDPVQHNLFVSGLSGFAFYDVASTLAPNPLTNVTGERGIAFNPENGFLYIGNFSSNNIYAIDETGKIQFNFPMASGLSVVQFVFAP